MFSKLVQYATNSVTSVVTKYLLRASVVIPFLFAAAFGLAGVTVILINEFGYRDAYFALAGGFGILGILCAVAVWLKERADEPNASHGTDPETKAKIASAAVETAKQMPAAFSRGTSGDSAGSLAKSVSRSWPLIVAVAVVALILGGATDQRYGRGRS